MISVLLFLFIYFQLLLLLQTTSFACRSVAETNQLITVPLLRRCLFSDDKGQALVHHAGLVVNYIQQKNLFKKLAHFSQIVSS